MVFKFFKNNKFLVFTLCIGLVLISFNSIKNVINPKLIQNKYDYSGKNSLFIENDNGLKFNWITNKADIGFYELMGADMSIISKGETKSGRVHSISIDQKINEELIFKFGGQEEPVHKIKLREISSFSNSVFKNVDSLFVVGDVHGRYDELINLLQKSLLINKDLQWIGGTSHLVFLGDLFDRGNDVTKVLWFIYELEEKAKISGGMVHLVLGNHEIMTMTKDLRYLGRKEAAIGVAYGKSYDQIYHPTNSFLGKWLTSKPSVIKIDHAILAHGGIVDLETKSIEDFNNRVQNYMKDPMFLDIMEEQVDSLKYDPKKWNDMFYFFYSEDSPFWYRGYVLYDTLAPQLNSMLRKYKSKIHVVAHTPLEAITQRYKGKLLTTDLEEAATQLLLLVRNKNKYERFKIDSSGENNRLN